MWRGNGWKLSPAYTYVCVGVGGRICLGRFACKRGSEQWQLKEAMVLLTPVALDICELCNDKKPIMCRTNRLWCFFPYLTLS